MEEYGDEEYYDEEMELVDSDGQPVKMINNGQAMYAYNHPG